MTKWMDRTGDGRWKTGEKRETKNDHKQSPIATSRSSTYITPIPSRPVPFCMVYI